MQKQLTQADLDQVRKNAAEIAHNAPLDLDAVEVLTAIEAASLVGAKLGIPQDTVLASASVGYLPEAA